MSAIAQTRNRGTIGGSLCHLDPAAELPACALRRARLCMSRARAASAMSRCGISRLGFMTPAIEPDEIVDRHQPADRRRGQGYAFEEYARRLAISPSSASPCCLARMRDGAITRAAIALCGVGSGPHRVQRAERNC